MVEFLGISHLFELSRAEAIAGLLTPLLVFGALFLLQVVLPGKRFSGYVHDPATGKPRTYRLNGLLVFAVALVVWALELTGMPRNWFYRSLVYAALGSTVLSGIVTLVAVFGKRQGRVKNPLLALWNGRDLELSFFKGHFDVKMYLYVAGGTMVALNALSGAVYHHELFGGDANPGVFLYAILMTVFIVDYFVFERVHLFTYDLIYEKLGFKLIWGCLGVYGWLYVLPLWGMAVHPTPGFPSLWTSVWLIGSVALFIVGWSIARGANMQKYYFKRWPERRFLGILEPDHIEAGERKILCSGYWGVARHFNYLGEWLLALAAAVAFGYFTNPWAWIYVVFIVLLLIFRQRLDDKYCVAKYGVDRWAEYRNRVKYRIIPGVY